MELVREALDDALHEVLLCDLVLAAHNLLHHAPLYNVLQDLGLSFPARRRVTLLGGFSLRLSDAY